MMYLNEIQFDSLTYVVSDEIRVVVFNTYDMINKMIISYDDPGTKQQLFLSLFT